jgi:hypothetical protein
MKTLEIPAIVEEAKTAGCTCDGEVIGYLAAEVSRLRGQAPEELRAHLKDTADALEVLWTAYAKGENETLKAARAILAAPERNHAKPLALD